MYEVTVKFNSKNLEEAQAIFELMLEAFCNNPQGDFIEAKLHCITSPPPEWAKL